MHDISDEQMARIIVKYSIWGTIGLFVVGMVIGLMAGVGPISAAGIAAVPAFFGGWFYGGSLAMLHAAYGPTRKAQPSALRPAVEHAVSGDQETASRAA